MLSKPVPSSFLLNKKIKKAEEKGTVPFFYFLLKNALLIMLSGGAGHKNWLCLKARQTFDQEKQILCCFE